MVKYPPLQGAMASALILLSILMAGVAKIQPATGKEDVSLPLPMTPTKRHNAAAIFGRFSSSKSPSSSASSSSPPTTTSSNNLASPPPASSSSLVEVPSTNAESSPSKGGGRNFVGSIGTFFRKLSQGTSQSFADQMRCNAIRAKVNRHAKAIRQQHREQVLSTAGNQNNNNRQSRPKIPKLKVPVGGISFDEFHFLQRGRQDLRKILGFAITMGVTPQGINYILYATLLFPKTLPSRFYNLVVESFGTGNAETKWDQLSRERSHGVLHALLEIEQGAKVSPLLSHLNFFGRKTRMQRRSQVEDWRRSAAYFLTGGGGGNEDGSNDTATGKSDGLGPQTILRAVHSSIYPTPLPSKKKVKGNQRRLGPVPEEVIHGMARTVFPRAAGWLPTFLARSQLAGHLQRLTEADEFLVRQARETGTSLYNVTQGLDPELLQEVCALRLIGGVGRHSPEQLGTDLAEWLQETVVRPDQYLLQQRQRQQALGTEEKPLEYNGILARATLMAYYATRGVRDDCQHHRSLMAAAPSRSELPADSFFLPDLLLNTQAAN